MSKIYGFKVDNKLPGGWEFLVPRNLEYCESGYIYMFIYYHNYDAQDPFYASVN